MCVCLTQSVQRSEPNYNHDNNNNNNAIACVFHLATVCSSLARDRMAIVESQSDGLDT